jgi:hypothetical protein
MRTMTFHRMDKLLERRNITAVPRRNVDCVRKSAQNVDNPAFDFPGQQGDLPMMPDFRQPEADITVLTIPLNNKRPAAATRKSRAENWLETERILTETLYENGRRRQCMCARARDRKRMLFISLESYVVRDVDYCQCAASCSALHSEGFFPSAPCKLGTVFQSSVLNRPGRTAGRTGRPAMVQSSPLFLVDCDDPVRDFQRTGRPGPNFGGLDRSAVQTYLI